MRPYADIEFLKLLSAINSFNDSSVVAPKQKISNFGYSLASTVYKKFINIIGDLPGDIQLKLPDDVIDFYNYAIEEEPYITTFERDGIYTYGRLAHIAVNDFFNYYEKNIPQVKYKYRHEQDAAIARLLEIITFDIKPGTFAALPRTVKTFFNYCIEDRQHEDNVDIFDGSIKRCIHCGCVAIRTSNNKQNICNRHTHLRICKQCDKVYPFQWFNGSNDKLVNKIHVGCGLENNMNGVTVKTKHTDNKVNAKKSPAPKKEKATTNIENDGLCHCTSCDCLVPYWRHKHNNGLCTSCTNREVFPTMTSRMIAKYKECKERKEYHDVQAIPFDKIKYAELKEVIIAANVSGVLANNIRHVGIKGIKLYNTFISTINDLDEDDQLKLPEEVIDFYNYAIDDGEDGEITGIWTTEMAEEIIIANNTTKEEEQIVDKKPIDQINYDGLIKAVKSTNTSKLFPHNIQYIGVKKAKVYYDFISTIKNLTRLPEEVIDFYDEATNICTIEMAEEIINSQNILVSEIPDKNDTAKDSKDKIVETVLTSLDTPYPQDTIIPKPFHSENIINEQKDTTELTASPTNEIVSPQEFHIKKALKFYSDTSNKIKTYLHDTEDLAGVDASLIELCTSLRILGLETWQQFEKLRIDQFLKIDTSSSYDGKEVAEYSKKLQLPLDEAERLLYATETFDGCNQYLG